MVYLVWHMAWHGMVWFGVPRCGVLACSVFRSEAISAGCCAQQPAHKSSQPLPLPLLNIYRPSRLSVYSGSCACVCCVLLCGAAPFIFDRYQSWTLGTSRIWLQCRRRWRYGAVRRCSSVYHGSTCAFYIMAAQPHREMAHLVTAQNQAEHKHINVPRIYLYIYI